MRSRSAAPACAAHFSWRVRLRTASRSTETNGPLPGRATVGRTRRAPRPRIQVRASCAAAIDSADNLEGRPGGVAQGHTDGEGHSHGECRGAQTAADCCDARTPADCCDARFFVAYSAAAGRPGDFCPAQAESHHPHSAQVRWVRPAGWPALVRGLRPGQQLQQQNRRNCASFAFLSWKCPAIDRWAQLHGTA